ncbi:uncharacterized protein LOC106158882 [Lingula anatina]|uniref:beta-N-acetylhexosaminidase n=1 Tax=Lingula anatina TaxID=7574 RepID=A0A1S3HWP4_LINAN|nr:uncharacterized protein LOC106158882 [Lingula anatina]|eukprot:XP_013390455.1 uncharacterized protein LOC106158882 [Lingula anatina]
MARRWRETTHGYAILALFLLCVSSNTVLGQTQQTLDYMGENLEIRYDVIDNTVDTWKTYDAQISLTNKGLEPIEKGDWAIYFCHIRLIEPENLPYPIGLAYKTAGMEIYHIKGCLFKLQPDAGFKTLSGGQRLDIKFRGQYWTIAVTDIMPNWYVASLNPSLSPRVIQSTSGESLNFVGPLDSAAKWKRYNYEDLKDYYDPYTPEKRYKLNDISNLGKSPLEVIPKPVELMVDSSVMLDLGSGDWMLFADPKFINETWSLTDSLPLTVVDSEPGPQQKVVILREGNVQVDGLGSSTEAYSIAISDSNKNVEIQSASAPGIFYGIQTLLSLITPDNKLPKIAVKDAPRYAFRGMHVDVARNFRTKEDILKLLKVMALYKLNKFHFHLSDDEGWRLEIPGLEELTSVGSKRCHDVTEKTCVVSQLGSLPNGEGLGSGYYTVNDYKEILHFANDRHIEVIPEVDSPGHLHAAIIAMKARSANLKEKGEPDSIADQYLLSEPNDTSTYLSVQYFDDNALNPCQESSYRFVEHVVSALIDMHRDIQPLKWFHYGGDEVPDGIWINSTICRNYFPSVNATGASIKEHLMELFLKKVSNITEKLGVGLAAWEDGLLGEKGIPFNRFELENSQIYSNAWQNVWEWGGARRAYDLANAGYKVVMSQVTHLYFDHPQEPDPLERGYYWGPRFTDTRKTFGFMPDNLFANVDYERSGKPLTEEEFCKDITQCVHLEKPENIIGIQGQLWSETMRTGEQFDFNVYPRLLALAERAWHKASWEDITNKVEREKQRKKDWERFANLLGYKELPRLDKMGVSYYLPCPGAKYNGSTLQANVAFSGLTVQISDDSAKTWADLSTDAKSDAKPKVMLRTKSSSGRTSRHINISRPVVASEGSTSPISIITLAALLLLSVCRIREFLGQTQQTLDYIGENLEIRYDVIDNTVDTWKTYDAQILLTNKGLEAIEKGDWAIYFCHIRLIEPENLPYPDGLAYKTAGIEIYHIKGCLFKLQPDDGFKTLSGGQRHDIKFKGQYWTVAVTDVMPNWYVASSNSSLSPRVIQSTSGESLNFVSPLDSSVKWKRYYYEDLKDYYDPYTPEKRYKLNDISNLGKSPMEVIPKPVEMTVDSNAMLDLGSGDWMLYAEPRFINETWSLTDSLPLTVVDSDPGPQQKAIILREGNVQVDGLGSSTEAYSIAISDSNKNVEIQSASAPGIFYGIQTLLSLITPDNKLPKIAVKDAPRYAFRGMYVDVARNFRTKEDILKLLKVMALYKLNKFHFHLSDDEGWRLEIPGLEELTSVGSKRCHDVTEKTCVVSQLGSLPNGVGLGSGYFTVDDYKEILRFANDRHIEVIPEVDTPGHSHAAIIAMKARSANLKEKGQPDSVADQYLLSEPNDTSTYLSVQYFDDNALNPCQESSYRFVEHVVSALIDMHRDIQPLKWFHYGGDEVPDGIWINSTICRNYFPSVNATSAGIKEHLMELFLKKVSNITETLGVGLAAWEDGLLGEKGIPFNRTELESDQIYSNAWQNVWEWGTARRAYDLANAGYKVVMSQVTHLYFDHPQEPDPLERGYYWGPRFTDTRKTFGFMPDNLFANVDYERSGKPLTEEEFCKDITQCVPLEKLENIIGIQGQLWSETMRTGEQFEFNVYPRLLALAERAWHKASWEDITNKVEREKQRKKDWERFSNLLGYKELPRLDKIGVSYYLPCPGAKYNGNTLQANVAFPGLTVQFSDDSGKTWADLNTDGESDAKPKAMLRTRSSNGRTSRHINISRPVVASGGSTSSISIITLTALLLLSVRYIESFF